MADETAEADMKTVLLIEYKGDGRLLSVELPQQGPDPIAQASRIKQPSAPRRLLEPVHATLSRPS